MQTGMEAPDSTECTHKTPAEGRKKETTLENTSRLLRPRKLPVNAQTSSVTSSTWETLHETVEKRRRRRRRRQGKAGGQYDGRAGRAGGVAGRARSPASLEAVAAVKPASTFASAASKGVGPATQEIGARSSWASSRMQPPESGRPQHVTLAAATCRVSPLACLRQTFIRNRSPSSSMCRRRRLRRPPIRPVTAKCAL
jgi:hypothetical protein